MKHAVFDGVKLKWSSRQNVFYLVTQQSLPVGEKKERQDRTVLFLFSLPMLEKQIKYSIIYTQSNNINDRNKQPGIDSVIPETGPSFPVGFKTRPNMTKSMNGDFLKCKRVNERKVEDKSRSEWGGACSGPARRSGAQGGGPGITVHRTGRQRSLA